MKVQSSASVPQCTSARRGCKSHARTQQQQQQQRQVLIARLKGLLKYSRVSACRVCTPRATAPRVPASSIFNMKRSQLPMMNATQDEDIYTAPEITYAKGLGDIRDGVLSGKKAVLLDQFGVLHDGKEAYPGALDAVRYLHADCGLRLYVISNSSRRAHGALKKLKDLGFDDSMFEGVITSGEVTYNKLRHRPEEGPWKKLKTCIHFTWAARGAISLEGMGIDVVENVEEADCVIAHGTEAIGRRVDGQDARLCGVDEMKQVLEACKGRGIPMIVANPDLVTVHGSELRVMPGTLGKWYEESGEQVYRMGKPERVIYEEALRALSLDASEVVAVGDSMEHDIQGAHAVGIDSIFIAAGIHKEACVVHSPSSNMSDSVDVPGVHALCEEFGGLSPKVVMPYFRI